MQQGPGLDSVVEAQSILHGPLPKVDVAEAPLKSFGDDASLPVIGGPIKIDHIAIIKMGGTPLKPIHDF